MRSSSEPLTAGTRQVQWLSNCTLEAPSGLTPSWRHLRDLLYQLRPISQSSFSPTSSSCLLSCQSLGAALQGSLETFHIHVQWLYMAGFTKATPPAFPWGRSEGLCLVLQQLLSSAKALPLLLFYFFSSVPPKVIPPKIPYMFFSTRVRLQGILPRTVGTSHPWKNKLQQKF